MITIHEFHKEILSYRKADIVSLIKFKLYFEHLTKIKQSKSLQATSRGVGPYIFKLSKQTLVTLMVV